MVDMLLMYSENSNYIKHVGLLSYVHCYSDEQLNLLTKLKSKCKATITGYLDSTVSVVRKASDDSERVPYYVVVANAPLPGKCSINSRNDYLNWCYTVLFERT